MEGVKCWKNAGNGFVVAEVHYTADPDRRGDWKYRASAKYGGLKSWRWRKEQEIDWDAKAGKLIFLNWDEDVHVPMVSFEPPAHWPRWIMIDPGWTNPTSMVWVAIDIDTKPNIWGHLPMHVYREFYKRRHSAHDLAYFCHEMSSPANRMGVRELESIEEIIIDPGAKQEHQSAASPEHVTESAETVFDQFKNAVENLGWNVPVKGGNNHKQEAIVELVQRLANYWIDSEGVPLYDELDDYREATETEMLHGAFLADPTIFIHPTAPNTAREIRQYVWSEWASSEVAERRNEQEKPIDKDDHSITNLIRFTNELRVLRGDVGDIERPGLQDLEQFESRFEAREVLTADEIAQRSHESRVRRYRKQVTGAA